MTASKQTLSHKNQTINSQISKLKNEGNVKRLTGAALAEGGAASEHVLVGVLWGGLPAETEAAETARGAAA